MYWCAAMPSPVAYQCLEAVFNRLELISTAGGFNTDPDVRLGLADVSPDEICPIIRVFETGDEIPDEGGDLCGTRLIDLAIEVEGIIAANESNSSQQLSLLWQDIMRSVFTADTTLGGLCISLLRGPRVFEYPQRGGQAVAVRQTAIVRYLETYGNP